jgi:hypothetical protein
LSDHRRGVPRREDWVALVAPHGWLRLSRLRG